MSCDAESLYLLGEVAPRGENVAFSLVGGPYDGQDTVVPPAFHEDGIFLCMEFQLPDGKRASWMLPDSGSALDALVEGDLREASYRLRRLNGKIVLLYCAPRRAA